MGPNQEVMETFQQFIDQGQAPGSRVIVPDNEKAASSMQIGLSRTGVRSIFCVTSEGVLWAMSEIHYAASSRLPMMIVCPSRALDGKGWKNVFRCASYGCCGTCLSVCPVGKD